MYSSWCYDSTKSTFHQNHKMTVMRVYVSHSMFVRACLSFGLGWNLFCECLSVFFYPSHISLRIEHYYGGMIPRVPMDDFTRDKLNACLIWVTGMSAAANLFAPPWSETYSSFSLCGVESARAWRWNTSSDLFFCHFFFGCKNAEAEGEREKKKTNWKWKGDLLILLILLLSRIWRRGDNKIHTTNLGKVKV